MDLQTLGPDSFAAIAHDGGAKVDGPTTSFACEPVEAGVDAQRIAQLPPDNEGCGSGGLMKL
jgi:hypothetical protein